MRLYLRRRQWNPMPGLEDEFPRRPDGSFERVWILRIGRVTVWGSTLRQLWKRYWDARSLLP